MAEKIEIMGNAPAESIKRLMAKNLRAELVAKETPMRVIPADYKIQAVKGFSYCYGSGEELPEEYRAEYLRYIKAQRKRLFQHALKHIPLLGLMLAEKMIKIDEIDALIESAERLNNAEISTMLLNYKNTAFTAEEKDRWEETLLTAQLTGVEPLSELNKKWRYEKSPNGGVRILGYKGKEKRVLVPEMIGGGRVTEIGDHAFSPLGKPLSDEVRRARREITAVYIHAGVRRIEENAFDDCGALKEVVIAPDNPFYSAVDPLVISKADGACIFCPAAISGDFVIPNGVTKIKNRMFYGCKGLTGVTLPESITEIGDYAFYGCESLTEVTIPCGVTKIGEYAFYRCWRLTSVVIPGGVREIERHTFDYCEFPRSVTIPAGVTKIGDYAFYGCWDLTSVVIPDGVREIGRYTFSYCRSLSSVMIPAGVTEIGEYAFYICTELTSVTIPESVTEIGEKAFGRVWKLTEIKIPQNIKAKHESEQELRNLLGIGKAVVIK